MYTQRERVSSNIHIHTHPHTRTHMHTHKESGYQAIHTHTHTTHARVIHTPVSEIAWHSTTRTNNIQREIENRFLSAMVMLRLFGTFAHTVCHT